MIDSLRRFLFCFSLGAVCAGAACAEESRAVTILPLGDSITEGGSGHRVYRYPLMEKLRAAGYRVAYVGGKTTFSDPGSPLGELKHEGYAGQNVGFLRARIDAIYRANPADIVLLHAGHNQFADRGPVPGMLADTRAIIESVRTINPKATVLLAQVIPSGKLPKYSYIPDFNQGLVALAAELDEPARRVILVDQAEGFDWRTDTTGDRVHPNAQGAEKMARRWFEALERILPAPDSRAASATSAANASAAATPLSLRLWPGEAPGLSADPGPELAEAGGRVSNVSVPRLDVYLPPAGKGNGAAIVICSGGGYSRLASGPLGEGAAKTFGSMGYAVFSLKYRTSPPSKDVRRDALADARRAVRTVRANAAGWGIDPKRVGLVGFSAGANLILNLAANSDAGDPGAADPIERQSCRPDFVGLAATWPHNQKIADFKIAADAPPAFVMHARDDPTARFAFGEEIVAAWTSAGVPVEFLAVPKGGHMAFNVFPTGADKWPARLDAWMRGLPLR